MTASSTQWIGLSRLRCTIVNKRYRQFSISALQFFEELLSLVLGNLKNFMESLRVFCGQES